MSRRFPANWSFERQVLPTFDLSMINVHQSSDWEKTGNMADSPNVPPELLTVLRQHSLFQRTNNESFVERLACAMHLRTYNSRDVIITEGEQAKAMFFVLRGEVEVCSADFERIYATLSKGSCFGEIGILYSMPRTATVIARSKCTVAALTAEEVTSLLPHFPEVEQVLRFEAEERLSLLHKSKDRQQRHTANRNPSVERNVETFNETGARDLLQKIPIFQDCPEEFLHHVSLKVEPRHYGPNTVIAKQGDEGKELYFVVCGTVELIASRDGESHRFAHRGAGDYFGDIAILLNISYSVDIRSVTAFELYVLSRADFLDVCNQYPQLRDRLKSLAEKTFSQLQAKIGPTPNTETRSGKRLMTLHSNTQLHGVETSHTSIIASPSINANSICSTTSDQDPTLPSAVSQLRSKETRRRRASIAVWTDQHLSAIAQKATDSQPKSTPTSPTRPTDVSEASAGQSLDRLTTLKDSVLVRIASYLDMASLLQLSLVSSRCRTLVVHSDKLFHDVDLSPYNKKMNDEKFANVAGLVLERAHSLSLSQCFHLTDSALKAVLHAPQLKSLDLNSCWLLTNQSLSLLGAHCPQLDTINISNCRKITDAGVLGLLESKHSTNPGSSFKSLSFSYCKNLTDHTMRQLAQYCSQSLEYLNMQRCTKVTDDGFQSWVDTPFTRLEGLVLTDCSFLTDKAVARLANAAQQLQRLSLSFCCALSDVSLETLATLPDLREVDASFCGAAVSDTSIHTLLQHQKVSSLNIRGCVRITDAGLQSVIDSRKLTLLNISQCPGITLPTKRTLEVSGNVENLVY